MSKILRILQLLPTLQRRGLEKVVATVAIGLQGHGYEIDVCCQRAIGPLASSLCESGIGVHCLNETGPRDLRAAARLFRVLARRHYDILHWHCPTAVGYQIPTAMLSGVPGIICTFHSTPESAAWPFINMKTQLTSVCAKVLSRSVDWVYGCSGAVLTSQLATGWFGCRSSVIYNGIDLPLQAVLVPIADAKARLGVSPSAVVIGCVGSLCEQKGQQYLIQALPLIRERVPVAQVLLIGTGPDCEMLKALARDRGCESSVVFAGEHEDVVPFFNAMDIFAFPSVAEGLGLALIEAMECGVPVVASAVGGVPEVVTHGLNGILVPPRDPFALAAAVLNLCTDRNLADSLRKQASSTVATCFGRDKMLEEVSELYQKILKLSASEQRS
jgi:glycosyltransferase involved in cell wall biosynthesis